MGWHDVVGLVGVACILGCYAGLQAGRLRADSLGYSLVNGVGAALVLVSLSVEWNLAAALVEGFWLLISLYGLARWWRRKAQGGLGERGESGGG